MKNFMERPDGAVLFHRGTTHRRKNRKMCLPMAAAAPYVALALTAASAATQYVSEKQAADDQNKYNAEMQKQGEKNARDAFIFNTNQETQRALQDDQANSFEIQRVHKERLQKQGAALASKESAGISLESLEAEFDQQEANYRSALDQEAEFKRQQSRANMKGYQAQYADRNAALAYNPVSGPSLVGAAAGLGAKAIGSYYSLKRDTKE